MQYVVTGATGHIGNNVVRMLLEQGHSVRVLVRREFDVALEGLNVQKCVGELCDMKFLLANIEAGCKVIHSAGVISITEKNSQEVYRTNVDATCCMVEACLTKGASLVYVSSTDALCGQGRITEPKAFYPDELVGSYAKSKAIAGNYVLTKARSQGLDACVVCPTAVIGDNDFKVSCVGQVISDYINGLPMARVKGGYNFVSVTDVARGIIAASQKGKSGECYLLSGQYMSVDDMFRHLNALLGKKHLPVKLPVWLVSLCQPLVNLYFNMRGKKPVFSRYALKCLNENKDYDPVNAREVLGYDHVTATQALTEACHYFLRVKKQKNAGK